ncbi:MAG: preprotein translocase subunit SecE [Candidatus Melainabacteria bacterium GWF2_37_15]|nr:MAG: preprotein translocase subunit SecE [Candidatus Melainabacteria bacterium GWF2_37_15]
MSETKKKELQKPGTVSKITDYFKGVRAEWDKVTWPERRQVAMETVVVIAVVVFFTVLVYFLDVIFNFLFKLMPGG